MQITGLQKALSIYLTGSLPKPEPACKYKGNNHLTDEELAEMEMTRAQWNDLHENSYTFKNPTLAQKADWNTLTGYLRNAELGVFDSLFSGIGAGLAKKIPFVHGLALALLTLCASLTSLITKLPFLSTNFSFSDFGGRLVRSPLRMLDSIFSSIGEKGSAFSAPSLVGGSIGLLTLGRVLHGKDDKSIEVPYATLGGSGVRAPIHHLESMLASKANELSSNNESLASFVATSATTLGLLLPKEITEKELPVETLEGLFSLIGPHFLDSLFTNIGNAFSPQINKPKNLALAALGFAAGLPILSSIPKLWNYKAPMPKLGGKLIRSISSAFDAVAFNAGNSVGKGILGIPLSLGFIGLTYITSVSSEGKKLFKNFKVPMNTIGSLVQRLPFDFVYSMISTVGTKLSKLIPAPLLVLIGPALSFKMSNQFKDVDAKYDDFKGLMIRNSVHLWEAMLASAAYRTGKMLTGEKDNNDSSGALLGEQWITDDGQIVKNMAVGKQIKQNKNKSILNIVLSAIGGVVFGLGAYFIGKMLLKNKSEPLKKEVSQAQVLKEEPRFKVTIEPKTIKIPKIFTREVAHAA